MAWHDIRYHICRGDAISYWRLDKPTIVGELPSRSSHCTAAEMLRCAVDNRFRGNLFWAYNDAHHPISSDAFEALRSFSAERPVLTAHANLLAWLRSLRPQPPGWWRSLYLDICNMLRDASRSVSLNYTYMDGTFVR